MENLFVKKYDKEKFMKNKPELVGIVYGIGFFEHPTRGDESPLIAIKGDLCGSTDYWELPSIEDLLNDNVI